MNFVPHRAMFLVLMLAAVGTSCSTAPVSRNVAMPTVAVALTSADGSAPSADQLARIYQVLEPEIQRAGFRFAENRNTADLVVLVRFTPTPGGSGGRVAIIGIEPGAEFRRTALTGETEETRELRRRVRELEGLAQRINPES